MKILKFEADWCGPCKQLGRWIDSVELSHPVTVVNIDEYPNAAAEHGIRGIPAVVVIADDGSKDVVVGFEPAKDLLKDFIV